MKYIQIDLAGEFEKFLPNVNTLWDENNFCTPDALIKDGKADDFGVVMLEEGPKPAHDESTEFIAEIEPTKEDGVWIQQWSVRPLSPEQIEAIRLASLPQEVTMGQCRLALYDLHGIETDEEFYSLANLLPEEVRPRARLQLATRQSVRYDNELVIAICEANGWDREALFVHGAAQ